jgi:ribosomal protein S18 acetylase RimI-like enzyme
MRYDDLTVRQATVADAAAVASLFDAYRQFYGKAPNLALAEQFVRHRLSNGDSLILIAEARSASAQPLGFAQLYPTFSSLACNRAWILNDLYVVPRARRSGVAEALMNAASEAARRAGVSSLSLQTAHDNAAAQALYVKLGYVLDEEFRTYSLTLGRDAAVARDS